MTTIINPLVLKDLKSLNLGNIAQLSYHDDLKDIEEINHAASHML